jgi:hypothetical protein
MKFPTYNAKKWQTPLRNNHQAQLGRLIVGVVPPEGIGKEAEKRGDVVVLQVQKHILNSN